MTLSPLPMLLAVVACAAYWLAGRRVQVPAQRVAAFAAGALAAGLAIAWDPASLTAHMVQHGLLTTVAAPLLVLGQPVALCLRLLPAPRRRRIYGALQHLQAVLGAWVGLSVFVLMQWLAHWPVVLDAAEAHPLAHAALHLTMLDVAILFWLPLLGRQPLPRPVGSARAAAQLLLAMPLVDLVSVPYLATGRGEAAAAMVASMLPLGIFAVGIAWRGLLREERRMLRREALL